MLRLHVEAELQAAASATQTPAAAPIPAQAAPSATPQETVAAQGGTIRGSVVAGTAGKAGGVPLPGVSVTATNTLTGRKYTTATDINGTYAMSIPRNGRYVVRAELTGFAPVAQEVLLGSPAGAAMAEAAGEKVSNFGLELAARVAAEANAQQAASARGAGGARGVSLAGGLQTLGVGSSLGDDTEGATRGAGGEAGVSMPSIAQGGNGESGGSGTPTESINVSGQQGSTNALATFSEDEIRDRVREGVDLARQTGLLGPGADPTEAIVGAIGGLLGGGGFGGPGGGGPGGGGRGGRGGGGGGVGGFGAFRNFNPAQPHGAVFWQGGNNALNSAPWQPTLLPQIKPTGYQNRFGVSLAGSPYLPGLTKPNTKQFVFINLTGQKNLNPVAIQPVRVPTDLERAGDFSLSQQRISRALVPVTLYDPTTHAAIPNNNLANATTPRSAAALRLLNTYYPACNIPSNCNNPDPSAYNYETVTNSGSNNVAINSRYVRTIGQSAGGPFGLGGRGGGGGGRSGQNRNAPPSLRQNINVGFNYSHSAADQRNIFLALGGANETDGYGLNVGYTIGYGRLSNNASVNWNRSSSQTRNYFTDTGNNPTQSLNINVPNQTGGFADMRFYNGVPHVAISNFAGLNNTNPNQAINQTVSFSDFVTYRHNRHNYRFGVDVRRVHADSIGGSTPLGQFQFTGYNTESAAEQQATVAGKTQQATSGAGLADFLFGLPTSTSIQASLFKTYLRQNVLDAYAQDDWRALPNVTLNYGVRWEYFSPYVEKNNRLVNLDHNPGFTDVDPVQPGQNGRYLGAFPRSLVYPDRDMFAPRFGGAWRPQPKGELLKKLVKTMVVRGGYGINYNTTQVTTFARQMSFQPPFAATETNTLKTTVNPNGCTSLSLENGFANAATGCTAKAIRNNYAVNPNYRQGLVQIYNLNIQRSLPGNLVLNVGYNGSKGSNLDIEYAANQDGINVITPNAQAFLYEDSIAGLHSNQLAVSVNQRQYKGLSLGLNYQYSHSIDNASSIGGTGSSTAQDPTRLDLEESNSSFDVRHRLTVNFTLQSPFGPNRPFLNKGGVMAKVLDGFILSGNGSFATGTYFTPQCSNCAAQQLAGGYYTPRPNRVFSQPIHGEGKLLNFFNTNAFCSPQNDPTCAPLGSVYGTASRNSIQGPGTTSINTSLSRLVQLGDTRSFEARMSANNVFNTVQYSSIDTTVNSATYGHVLSAGSMRTLQFEARYRF